MILVIDDNEAERTLVRRVLEGAGYAVREAADGVAGVVLFQAERPELVICDLMMPGQDGFETIRQIITLAPEARVVAISGYLFGVDHAALRENYGLAGIVEKPFGKVHLLEVVRSVLTVG